MESTLPVPTPAGKPLRIALWVAQFVIGFAFSAIGLMKLGTPIAELATQMPWAGQYPATFVRFIGLVDLAGGLGVLLPALTRIQPQLTVWAAAGCSLLQVLAIAFHVSRGEISVLPLNAIFLALALFVLWGRARRAPIVSRGAAVPAH